MDFERLRYNLLLEEELTESCVAEREVKKFLVGVVGVVHEVHFAHGCVDVEGGLEGGGGGGFVGGLDGAGTTGCGGRVSTNAGSGGWRDGGGPIKEFEGFNGLLDCCLSPGPQDSLVSSGRLSLKPGEGGGRTGGGIIDPINSDFFGVCIAKTLRSDEEATGGGDVGSGGGLSCGPSRL